MIYKIGEAAKILGLTATTLRTYEKKGYLIPDSKTITKHRRYSKEQIDEYIKNLRK